MQETAINIGFSSRLINENMDLIKINASSPVCVVHDTVLSHIPVCICTQARTQVVEKVGYIIGYVRVHRGSGGRKSLDL